ncbi:MAG: hypothetical protein JO322_00155 [Candidatus Eremiobacteraeota bacterium]|nr:hypothetical protein [Candidatus Eremiobacteraeota bacterium]
MRRSAIALTLVAVCATILTACGKSSNVTTASSSAAPAASGGTVVAQAGSTFRGKLQQEISTKKSHDGDRFTIVGSTGTVEGHLENVQAAGFGKKPSMVIVFDDLKMSDGTVAAPIDVKIESAGAFNAKSHHFRTFGMMIGGAVAGHMAASAAHTKHGGLAGAASAYVLSQQMKTDVDVRPGTTVVLKFNKDAVGGASASSNG